jgi:hypothetical protein
MSRSFPRFDDALHHSGALNNHLVDEFQKAAQQDPTTKRVNVQTAVEDPKTFWSLTASRVPTEFAAFSVALLERSGRWHRSETSAVRSPDYRQPHHDLAIAIDDLVGDDPADDPLTSAAGWLCFIVVDAAMNDQGGAIVIKEAPLPFPQRDVPSKYFNVEFLGDDVKIWQITRMRATLDKHAMLSAKRCKMAARATEISITLASLVNMNGVITGRESVDTDVQPNSRFWRLPKCNRPDHFAFAIFELSARCVYVLSQRVGGR